MAQQKVLTNLSGNDLVVSQSGVGQIVIENFLPVVADDVEVDPRHLKSAKKEGVDSSVSMQDQASRLINAWLHCEFKLPQGANFDVAYVKSSLRAIKPVSE